MNNKSVLWIFLLIFLFTQLAANAQMSKFQNSKPGYNYTQSIVLRTPNNDMLYFWESSTDLFLSRSTNNGQSWTDSVLISNNDYNPFLPPITDLNGLTTSSGRIFLFYYSTTCLSQYSDDNGTSWSAPASMNLGSGIWGGVLSQSPTGKLFYVFSK